MCGCQRKQMAAPGDQDLDLAQNPVLANGPVSLSLVKIEMSSQPSPISGQANLFWSGLTNPPNPSRNSHQWSHIFSDPPPARHDTSTALDDQPCRTSETLHEEQLLPRRWLAFSLPGQLCTLLLAISFAGVDLDDRLQSSLCCPQR